jgi:hypothetical protein
MRAKISYERFMTHLGYYKNMDPGDEWSAGRYYSGEMRTFQPQGRLYYNHNELLSARTRFLSYLFLID